MSISPDTDAIYEEAISLQPRMEEFEQRRQQFDRLQRDKALELLSNGYLPDAAPEIRIQAVSLRANQILQEEQKELFEYLDSAQAAFTAIDFRNKAIIAAGWAENFALNSLQRRFYQDERKGKIES